MKISKIGSTIAGFAIAAFPMVTVGCKTLAPVATLDQNRNEVVFVTTSDERTASPALADDRGVKDARASLLARIKTNPLDGSALIDLSRLALVAEKIAEAEGWAKRALRADTRNVEAKKILAMVALQRRQLDLAEVFLNSLDGSQSKDSAVLNLIGQLRLARGRNLLAAEAFKRALELNPNDIATRMNLGVLYLKHRQYNQAGVQFERVLSVMPKHDDAGVHMAMVEAHRGKTKVALESLTAALSRNPNSELVLFNLASVEREAGQLENAKAHLKMFLTVSKTRNDETELVASILEDIHRQQAAEGNKVSDNEILTLAAKIKAAPSATKPEINELPPELVQAQKMAEPAKTPVDPESNNVSELERALQ